MSKIRFIGLDVHADTIAASVAEPDGEVRPLGIIPNRLESVRKMVAKLGPVNQLKACYEAGPTGYVLYWQMTALGVACEVVAPSLVPVKAGDRVTAGREILRVLRPGGRVMVVATAERQGLAALLRGGARPAPFDPEPTLASSGFAAVRRLAEREGLVFVEALKPRTSRFSPSTR